MKKAGSPEWTEVAQVKGNFYRLRRHRFEPVRVDAMRLRVSAANGDDLARVFEVRCYA